MLQHLRQAANLWCLAGDEMRKYVNGHYIDMTAEEIKQQQALEQTENTQTLEDRLDAVEQTSDATATAVEELIDIVLGGEE